MEKFTAKKITNFILGITIALLGFQCAGVEKAIQQMKPVVPKIQLKRVQLTGLSFTGATLHFQFQIHNPNPIDLSLNGFEYALQLENNQPLINGTFPHRTTIPARGDSLFTLPVSFTYGELYHLIRDYVKRDSIPYTLQATFYVMVPLLGEVTIPVEKSGTLPVIRPPQFTIQSIQLNSISWTRARLTLTIGIKNPNFFSVALHQLEYRVGMDDQAIASGALQSPSRLVNHQSGTIEIPIELNFLQLGKSIYQMLTQNNRIPVHFSGKAIISTSLPLLQDQTIPFDLQSSVTLQK